MDENKEVVSKEVNGNYISGIIGATIGGIIGTIPWILVYVFGNMMLSILAAVIAIGEFYGYKLFKGKITKKLPIIMTVIAIIIITIATFLVIPACLLAQDDYIVNMDNISRLYTYSDFTNALIRDYIISLVFTLLGTSIITSNLKRQIDSGKEQITLKNEENSQYVNNMLEEAKKVIKPVFERYGAINEENTMTKDEILAEIEQKDKVTLFNALKSARIIVAKNGRYYYSVENEKNPKITNKMSKGQLILTIIIVVALVAAMSYSIYTEDSDNTLKYSDGNTITQVSDESSDVKFDIKNGWADSYGGYYEGYGWNYYKYISYIPTEAELQMALSQNEDLDYKYIPASINVDYDSADAEKIETYINQVLTPDYYNIDTFTSQKGYLVLEVELKYNEVTDEIPAVEYIYYIWNDGILGYITSASYLPEDEAGLKEATLFIANSFEWKNK